MQTSDITPERVRRLAQLRFDGAHVMSVYVNLDPTQFATPPARSTEVRSLLDEAERIVRHREDLSHDQRMALREDLARLEQYFELDFPTQVKGAHGMAVFCSGPAGFFESLRLPRAVERTVVIDSTPFIEPLAGLGRSDRWCVALLTRRNARILRPTTSLACASRCCASSSAPPSTASCSPRPTSCSQRSNPTCTRTFASASWDGSTSTSRTPAPTRSITPPYR
jgi:hypothetical protein